MKFSYNVSPDLFGVQMVTPESGKTYGTSRLVSCEPLKESGTEFSLFSSYKRE